MTAKGSLEDNREPPLKLMLLAWNQRSIVLRTKYLAKCGNIAEQVISPSRDVTERSRCIMSRDPKRLPGYSIQPGEDRRRGPPPGPCDLFVLMNHVNMRLLIAHVPYTNGLPEQLVSSLVWNGQPGVQIFFVVSGFLITATTLRRWGAFSQVSLRGFYLMRFARIVPLLLLPLSVLSILHLAQVKYFVVSSKTGGLGRALIAALYNPTMVTSHGPETVQGFTELPLKN